MAFIPVANTVEVEAVFELDGQIVENTISYWKPGGVSLSDINDLLAAVNAAITTNLMPLLHNSIQLVRLIGTLLDAADSVGAVLSVIPAVPGGNAGSTSLPSNVAFAVQFKTALSGRSHRGRNYVPGIPATARSAPNTISSTYRDSLLTAYIAIGAAGADAGFQHVVVSRFADHAPRTTGIVTPITSYASADLTVDSQRRRLPGRGS